MWCRANDRLLDALESRTLEQLLQATEYQKMDADAAEGATQEAVAHTALPEPQARAPGNALHVSSGEMILVLLGLCR